MEFQILKDSDAPIYRQIVSQILYFVQKGELASGDKLPSERVLSKELDVSRGTITKAYSELANMEVVTLIKGKGCFVSREKEFLSLGRKDKAVLMIKNNINALQDLGFSLSEIRIFSEIVLMEKEKHYDMIKIGIIDCNREALHAIHCQIGTIKELSISKYMLEEIESLPIQSDIMEKDIIITTYRHYEDVLRSVPAAEDKLIRVAMSPSKKTLIELGRLTKQQRLGILYDSDNFLGVIERELKIADVGIDESIAMKIDQTNKDDVAQFIKNKEVLILPPLTFFETSYRRFLMLWLGNKPYIEFNYLIERGNFLYLEEKIRHFMVSR